MVPLLRGAQSLRRGRELSAELRRRQPESDDCRQCVASGTAHRRGVEPTTAVRLCMLGCGAVARTHSRVARSLGGIELLYASRSLEKAETYNRRFGGIGAFGSYEEACADPRVDAVIVCTPQAFHVEHATLAARHDKATLIEKPVTRTLGELAAIEAAVRRAGGLGRVCMVAENYHFKPALRVLRRHLDAGDIGQALFIELNRAGRQRPTGWRADAAPCLERDQPPRGSRPLQDLRHGGQHHVRK